MPGRKKPTPLGISPCIRQGLKQRLQNLLKVGAVTIAPAEQEEQIAKDEVHEGAPAFRIRQQGGGGGAALQRVEQTALNVLKAFFLSARPFCRSSAPRAAIWDSHPD